MGLLQYKDLLNSWKFLLRGALCSIALPRAMSRFVVAPQNISPVFIFHFQANNNKNSINFERRFSDILSRVVLLSDIQCCIFK
jgi:hypothetical protein